MQSLNRSIVKWARSYSGRRLFPDWTPRAITESLRSAVEGLHGHYHSTQISKALTGQIANLEDVRQYVCDHAVRLNVPMVLISQVQRSGGTLLSQLFDAHPSLAAYPHELRFSSAYPDEWPRLEPARGMDSNFRALYDLSLQRMVRRGFAKGDRGTKRHPFMLIPNIQYAIFKRMWEVSPPADSRDVANTFYSAFFNAWLNHLGCLEDVKWITAFSPRLAHDEASMRRFFETYPDGYLIQIIRNPKSWYPSVKRHRQSGLNSVEAEQIMQRWKVTAESMQRNRELFGERVIFVSFDDLVGQTEQVMRSLSRRLGITFDPILCRPTFNGNSMKANSSFEVEKPGVIDTPLKREESLTGKERRLIERNYLGMYEDLAPERFSRAS